MKIILSPNRLLHTAVLITCLTLITQYLISFQLWIPAVRAFPLVSAFEWLPLDGGITGDAVLLYTAVASLLVLTFSPTLSFPIHLFVAANICLVLEDIPRLQPWLYLDVIFFLAIDFYRRRSSASDALVILRLLIALTYFWSGFQKFNYAFSVEIFPWLAGSLGLKEFFESHRMLVYLFPAVEVFVGLSMLVSKFERTAVTLGIGMHLFLLWALGPFGAKWNVVIWPWNVQMIVWLLIVYRSPKIPWRVLTARQQSFALAVFVLAGVMPVLNFFGLFDNHLSGSLYSANNPEAIFCYDSTNRERLPASSQAFQFSSASMGIEYVTLDQWFIAETEAPFYPERRYFRRVGELLARRLSKPKSSYVLMNVKTRFTSEQHLERLPTR